MSPCILVKEAVRIKERLQKKCCQFTQPPKVANTMSLEICWEVKTTWGGLHDSHDESDGKMFAVPNSLKCPVKTVQNYLNHLNSELEILFQRPREASSKFQAQKDQVWFCNSNMMKTMSFEASCNYSPLDQPLCSGDVGYSSIWPQCWSKAYQDSNWT